MSIRVTVADITTLAVDAIVNAANPGLLGGGGVDGAIHRVAGPGLLAECAALPQVAPGVRCPTGQARITGGHRLPARHVIHTVGPVWNGGGHGEAGLLASAYRQCLQLAEAHGLDSLAFPAISCGVYGYPRAQASTIAVTEVAAWMRQHACPGEVILCSFDADMAAQFQAALAAIG